MTEDDAKTKWCPFVRAIVIGTRGGFIGPANRAVGKDGSEGRDGARCIGSACMAWRWAGYRAKDGAWVRKTADGPWDPTNADGFCGLAGSQ